MAFRDAGPEPLASWGASAQAGHVGRSARLVDEDQACRVNVALTCYHLARLRAMSGRACSAGDGFYGMARPSSAASA